MKYDKTNIQFSFFKLNNQNFKTIFKVWFVRFDWSFVYKWYVVDINKLIFNLKKIVRQKFDMNFLFLSLTINRDMFQSFVIKLMMKTLIQFFVVYVNLSNKIMIRLMNLFVIVMTQSKSSFIIENSKMKSMIIMWNDIVDVIIDWNDSYEKCRLIWLNWHFEQCSMYVINRLINRRM